MGNFYVKRLLIIVRGLPCIKRSIFVDRFAPENVFRPKYTKPPMVKNTIGVTNRSAQARKQPTLPQEDLLFASVVIACQAQQPLILIDADLSDQERVNEYLKIATHFRYSTKIITFRPDSLPKWNDSHQSTSLGIHFYDNRFVDYRKTAQQLLVQKRYPTEKWIKVQLKNNFQVLESKGHAKQRSVPKRT